MEETLKMILKKLEKLDSMDSRFDKIESKFNDVDSRLDKMESDMLALKSDNKTTHQKLDMLIDEVANIKEQITDYEIKIQKINKKTNAI